MLESSEPVQSLPEPEENQRLIEFLAQMRYALLLEEPINISTREQNRRIGPVFRARSKQKKGEIGPYTEGGEIQDEGQSKEERQQYATETFTHQRKTAEFARSLIAEALAQGKFLTAKQSLNSIRENKNSTPFLRQFRNYVAGLKTLDPERAELASSLKSVLLKRMIHDSNEEDGEGLSPSEKIKFTTKNLTDLAHTANAYFAYLNAQYLGDDTNLSLRAGVQNCNDIGELFLIACDKKSEPVARRDATSKLIFIILLAELQDYHQESEGAMKRMTDILNEHVFVCAEGEGIDHVEPFFLHSTHNSPGHFTTRHSISKNKLDTLGPEEKQTPLPMRRFMGGSDAQPEEACYVFMDNRQKNLLQRLSKLLREGKLPGEKENDLHGFRFVTKDKQDQERLMNKIISAILHDTFAKTFYLQGPHNPESTPIKMTKWLAELLGNDEKAKSISIPSKKEGEKKAWLISKEPVPISEKTLEELRSPEAEAALGMNIATCPVFITEWKDNFDGSNGFNGSDKTSSGKLKVLKFKLHVANPKKPGHYDQFEFQFTPPEGYTDMLYADDIRHSKYEIMRVFDNLLPMIFSSALHGVDLAEAKKIALKKENRKIWPKQGLIQKIAASFARKIISVFTR